MTAAKLIPFGLIAILIVAVLWLWERNQNLKDDLSERDAIIERHHEAQRIHKRYVEIAETMRVENEALRRELLEMEGGDAALSDYLSRVAERVYGQ